MDFTDNKHIVDISMEDNDHITDGRPCPCNATVEDYKKPKRIQGKLNINKVIAGVLAGKKKKDIALIAGSQAETLEGKINSVNNVVRSDEYKKKTKTLIDKLQEEIDRLIDSMLARDHNSVEYKDMANAIEKLIKNKELLSGGATDRIKVDVEEMKGFLDKA